MFCLAGSCFDIFTIYFSKKIIKNMYGEQDENSSPSSAADQGKASLKDQERKLDSHQNQQDMESIVKHPVEKGNETEEEEAIPLRALTSSSS